MLKLNLKLSEFLLRDTGNQPIEGVGCTTLSGYECYLLIHPLYLSRVSQGLADESEYVRDTSLKAGQRIVNLYADTAIELFLPQLETGLFDDNWRIRHSSVQLLGDLLYRISGVTGKMSTEGQEDDNFGTSQSNQVMNEKSHYAFDLSAVCIIIFHLPRPPKVKRGE